MEYIDDISLPLSPQGRGGTSTGNRHRLPPMGVKLPPGFERSPQVVAVGRDRMPVVGLLRRGRALTLPASYDWHPADLTSTMARPGRANPTAIALDLKPRSALPQYPCSVCIGQPMQLYPVQTHHAQLAARLVDHGQALQDGPVLGLILDEPTHGTDGTLWGGDIVRVDYRRLQRLATLKPIALLGHERTMAEPWRNTYAHLIASFDWDDVQAAYGDLEIIQFLHAQPRMLLNQLLITGRKAPKTSSVLRWMEAVAAALYPGQGGIVEGGSLSDGAWDAGMRSPYPFGLDRLRSAGQSLPYLDPRPMWYHLLEDLSQGEPLDVMAARFQVGLGNAIATLAIELAQQQGLNQIARVGHLDQRYPRLAQHIDHQLTTAGYTVLSPSSRSPDLQLILGQLAVTAARLLALPSETTAPAPTGARVCS
jgi:hydrogenase maturation protein HypF